MTSLLPLQVRNVASESFKGATDPLHPQLNLLGTIPWFFLNISKIYTKTLIFFVKDWHQEVSDGASDGASTWCGRSLLIVSEYVVRIGASTTE